VRRAMCRDG